MFRLGAVEGTIGDEDNAKDVANVVAVVDVAVAGLGIASGGLGLALLLQLLLHLKGVVQQVFGLRDVTL